jgi:peptidyl-tRNA hydrolase, PTH1 family
MRVVVGLGNPGTQYADSRHNVGFMVIEELARRWELPLGRARLGVRMAEGSVAGARIILVQPRMYMNLSGAALARLKRPFAVHDLIVIHDDLDLDTGCVRVKRGGGTAGHHGLDSLVEHWSNDFTRIRVGVGHPPRGQDVAEYVLAPFDTEERDMISAAVDRAADAVETIVRAGETAAMNQFNTRAKNGGAAVTSAIGRRQKNASV